MKGSEEFKATIKKHLDDLASKDVLFARAYNKPHKNLNECIKYVIGWVKESKCNVLTENEVYGRAIHYYDEDNINKPPEVMRTMRYIQTTAEPLEDSPSATLSTFSTSSKNSKGGPKLERLVISKASNKPKPLK